MQSYSSANGTSVITCTFALGTDPTTDQTNVQHGVDLTLAQLPTAVQNQGVTVEKSSGNITIAVAMLSTSSAVSDVAVSNYADLNVIENLKRVPGRRPSRSARRPYVRDADLGRSAQARGEQRLARHRDQRHQAEQRRRRARRDRPAADRRAASRSRCRSRSTGGCTTPDEFKQIVVAGAAERRLRAPGRRRRTSSSARRTTSPPPATTAQTAVVLAIEGEPTANSLQISQNVRSTMAQICQDHSRPATITRSPSTRPTSCSASIKEVDRDAADRHSARHASSSSYSCRAGIAS